MTSPLARYKAGLLQWVPAQTSPVPAPLVTSLSPSSGSKAGGNYVDIVGTNLYGAYAVTFGGQVVPQYRTRDTLIRVTAPNGSGAVDVIVRTPFGSYTAAGAYTYTPYVIPDGITPAAGPDTGGGAPVTIEGLGLSGCTSLMFGSSDQTAQITSNTDSAIALTSPQFLGGGTVDITIVCTAGTVVVPAAYTFF